MGLSIESALRLSKAGLSLHMLWHFVLKEIPSLELLCRSGIFEITTDKIHKSNLSSKPSSLATSTSRLADGSSKVILRATDAQVHNSGRD